MPRFFEVSILLLLAGFELSANTVACVPGTLSSYIALGATGCTIGTLTVENFSFSSSVGAAVSATGINVTINPSPTGGAGVGLVFASSGFSVSGAGSANYQVGFTWDPSGDIRGAGDVLDPGTVDITTSGCVGAPFSSGCGTPISLHVFEGTTSQLTASVTFPSTGILGISNNISLSANGSFTSIENDVFVPEPLSALLLAAGLTVLFALRRRHGGEAG